MLNVDKLITKLYTSKEFIYNINELSLKSLSLLHLKLINLIDVSKKHKIIGNNICIMQIMIRLDLSHSLFIQG